MSTALFTFDRPDTARRACERLRQDGISDDDVTLHLPRTSPGDRTAAAVDEQVTGGVLTNVAGLFGEVFEWGSLPIDASAYAAAVRRGGAVVSVHTVSASQRSSVDMLMVDEHAVMTSGWFQYPAERGDLDGRV